MAVRLCNDEDLVASHEINVPLVIDVILVPLIIFMVAAPLATVDVKVELPNSTAEPAPKPDNRRDLTVQADKETRVFLRADKSVDSGALMEVMDGLRAASDLRGALVGLEGRP